MKPVVVTATLRAPDVVAGCAVAVRVTITSTAAGTELVLVQAEGADLPFEYELHGADGSVAVVSKSLYDGRLYAHPNPAPAVDQRPLRAGESAVYDDDVAAWMPAPLAAGDYTLVVHWKAPDGDDVAAAPVTMRVAAAHPSHAASVVDFAGQHLVTLFAHVGASGSTLFERKSANGKAELGRGLARHHAVAAVGGVAVATEVDEPVDWRWLAWLEAGTIRGALTWGDEVMNVVDAGAHGLTNATLLPQGWQWADGSGLFVLVGARGPGGPGSCVLVLFPKGLPPQHHAFDLGGPPPLVAAAGYFARAYGVLELVRADAVGPDTRVAAHRIDLASPGAAGALRPLYQVGGAVRALAVAPLLTDAPIVDAIVGDTYYRVPLLGGPGAAAWAVAARPGATELSIPAIPHPDAPTLAREGNALYLARVALGTGWSRIAESHYGVVHPQAVHLTVPDGTMPRTPTSTWFDGARGYSVLVEPEGA